MTSVTPSPFHGIFSSLGQEDGKASLEKSDLAAFAQGTSSSSASSTQSPIGQVAVDIYEQDNYFIIKAPIAGVHMNDLDIEVSDNVLTIKGSRRQTDEIAEEKYYLQECFWGEFSRSITLPFIIDPKKIRATFNKEGVLKVIVPREEKIKIVKINEG
jgi:HSP20 family protein